MKEKKTRGKNPQQQEKHKNNNNQISVATLNSSRSPHARSSTARGLRCQCAARFGHEEEEEDDDDDAEEEEEDDDDDDSETRSTRTSTLLSSNGTLIKKKKVRHSENSKNEEKKEKEGKNKSVLARNKRVGGKEPEGVFYKPRSKQKKEHKKRRKKEEVFCFLETKQRRAQRQERKKTRTCDRSQRCFVPMCFFFSFFSLTSERVCPTAVRSSWAMAPLSSRSCTRASSSPSRSTNSPETDRIGDAGAEGDFIQCKHTHRLSVAKRQTKEE